MMKVLIFSQYYNPERFLLNSIAPELVKRGHEVTVITGVPNYPEGVIYPGYFNKDQEEVIEGVKVIRCKIIPRGHTKIRLFMNYLSYMLAATQKAKKLKKQYDVVFLYQLTPIFQAYPAIYYAKNHRRKVLCYCLDLAPASGEDVIGRLKPLFKVYKNFSRWAYGNCDHIAVSSKLFKDYLADVHKIDTRKISYLPQHAPDDLLTMNLDKEKHDEVIDFMFAGNIGYGSRLDHFINVAKKLKTEGFQFRINIVGDGSDKSRLVKIVNELELNDVVFFHGSVPMSHMPDYYKKTDALLISLRKNQLTVPGKLQSYMATGKPVLASMDGSGREIINEAKCGICVDAENEIQILNMLKEYLTKPEQYIMYGIEGQRFFREHFTLNVFVNTLESILTELYRTTV